MFIGGLAIRFPGVLPTLTPGPSFAHWWYLGAAALAVVLAFGRDPGHRANMERRRWLHRPDARSEHASHRAGDATSPQDSVISVHVGDDVDEAYAEAQRCGYEIVHPLTDEPWGVRRFFVRAPDGNVINIVSHRDE